MSNAIRAAQTSAPELADALYAWALRKTGSAVLARALAQATRAERDGHACVRLAADGRDPWDPAAIAELAEHSWVGDGSQINACVLTPERDFFLWRNWRHEERVANALRARLDASIEVDPASLVADLNLLFAGMDAEHCAGQRLAVERSVGKRIFVLSGGPGTGKTTTVLRILLMLQRVAAARGRTLPSMALAAPTGKAAQRLSQALRDGKSWLAEFLDSRTEADVDGWRNALSCIPEAAQTLHRLLGANPAADAFNHDVNSPLPFDIVVVDEASMVDLALMRALLDALAPDACLILVGDPDQLVSVSAGSVLADIVHVTECDPDGIGRCAARLSHVWRADQDLAQVYEAARQGSAEGLAERLQRVPDSARHDVANGRALQARLEHWLSRPEWLALQESAGRSGAIDFPAAMQALRALQLLTALRAGPFGADMINPLIDNRMRVAAGGATWYPGRPVLIRNNDYSRRLFNGDVGLTCGSGSDLQVYFESVDADGRIHARRLSPRELPEHDLAYALTVHKSQGSEYDHVAVLLPPDPSNRILSRQMIYTAISRAKRSVEIWSTPESLGAALAQLNLRAGGLRRRLQA